MIYGIGTDVVEVIRIKESIEKYGDKLAKKILTDEEVLKIFHFARFDLASQALERFQDLKDKGFISNQELDKASSEYLVAQAQVVLSSLVFQLQHDILSSLFQELTFL